MPFNLQLVIIDPQNSFCKVVPADRQQVEHDGELCVPGAWDDMVRLSAMIKRLGSKLDDIHVTLDSHQLLHIAHPIWFKDNYGNNPGPFTIMRNKGGEIIGTDLNGQEVSYTTTDPKVFRRTLDYLKALETGGRYPHCIWPPHCLIGTPGFLVVEPLMEALIDWSKLKSSSIGFVTKGSNPFTEHFGAVQAEVPDPNDPSTQLNTAFIKMLDAADEVLISGEALSHCTANTFRDMANQFADDSFIKKCVLLTDASTSVPGFEKYGTDFVDEMKKRGMKTATTTDYLAKS